MSDNITVGIWNKGPTTKVNGITIPGILVLSETIDVEIQPYTTSLLLKDYGYNIEVDRRVFYSEFDANMKVGTVIKYIDKYGVDTSLTIKLIPWDDDHMELTGLRI